MDYMDFRLRLATDRDFVRLFEACRTESDLIYEAAQYGYTFTQEDIEEQTTLLPEELELAVGGSEDASFGTIFCRKK